MKKILLLVLVLPLLASAQKQIEIGDVYYDFFQYKEAIRAYEIALKTERTFTNEAHLLTQLAYSYTYTFQYEKAETYFAELVKLGDKKQVPDIYLDYGNVLKVLGKYTEALNQYNYYTTIIKPDEYTASLIKSVTWADKHKDSVRTNTIVTLTNLNIGGQSLGYTFFADGLLYAHPKDTNYSEYTMLYDLRYAKLIDSVTFTETKEYVNDIKFPFNEGSPTVSPDGEILYFTATATKLKKGAVKKIGNMQISEDGVSNLKIYTARFINGSYTNIIELPFNDKQYNCTHPCISPDGSTLFFASDMPGGFGGLDIYKSVKAANGTWSKPINMGNKINTPENEMYPFLADNYLYFSSKGHLGFGGYDLFQTMLGINYTPLNARNMGKPFNSSKDDVAFIISGDGVTGYFSSNRDNNNGIDKVYYFRDQIAAPVTPVIIASATPKPNQPITPSNTNAATTKPVETISGNKVADGTKTLSGKTINTVYYGFNKSNIQPSFITLLDSTLLLVKSLPDLTLKIYAHTDCRGSDEYNLALSRRRALSVKNYLVSKGFKREKIGLIYYGESKPKIGCEPCEACTEEEHKENRRVEVKVVN